MPKLRLRGIVATLAAPALLFATPAAADEADWAKASDITVGALMAASLGVPLIKKDGKGAVQAGLSIVAAGGASQLLKEAFPETRPDGSDRKSFPSGHTTVSFAAAASLQNRYGWQIGLPAHAAAAFVGLARVEADKHHWYDVAVGAALGEATGLLITSKQNENVQVFPWAGTKGGGVVVAARF